VKRKLAPYTALHASDKENTMPETEQYDVLVIGSGEAGKYLAWTLSTEGYRTALVERKFVLVPEHRLSAKQEHHLQREGRVVGGAGRDVRGSWQPDRRRYGCRTAPQASDGGGPDQRPPSWIHEDAPSRRQRPDSRFHECRTARRRDSRRIVGPD